MVTMIRSDLDFILAQIKIAEADADGVDLVATGLIPNPELPWGLRRVDGSNNNLIPGQDGYGAADQPFPRSTDPSYTTGTGDLAFGPPVLFPTGHPQAGQPMPGFEGNVALGIPPGYAAGVNWLNQNQYAQPTPNTSANPQAIQPGDVADAAPRVISNLIVDQTANNPAVIYKALVDAGVVTNPFATMGLVTAAVDNVKAEKIALAPLEAAVAAAEAALADAEAGITPALQATMDAYSEAIPALTLLAGSAAAVVTATSDLLAALSTGGSIPDVLDTDAYADAQTTIGQLVIDAQAVVDALSSDVNVTPADRTAAENLLSDASSMQAALGLISLNNGIDGGDTAFATGLAEFADDLPTTIAALDAQVDASLAALTPPDLTAAQVNLAIAQGNFDSASSSLTAAESALRTLLTNGGVTLEESPDGDILQATLFVQNVAPDEGLSAPFNGWMTIFGQFFDHGLDLVGKGGYGTVYIPLQTDDPLYDPNSSTNFMAVTRATLDPATGQPVNKVTPFVDQNQTYTSNASAQVFHREYVMRMDTALGYEVPHATGRLLNGAAGGLATWADIKTQALTKLGIALDDFDIHDIPQLMVDDYGNFIRGANGFPQIVTSNAPLTVASGTPGSPVDASLAVKTGHAFLDDIAHNANPGQFDNQPGPGLNLVNETPDADATASTAGQTQAAGTYDNELLDAHYITGDGRGNENIALTAVHHVFHAEHNRQVDKIKELVLGEAKSAVVGSADAAEKLAFLNEWLATDLTPATLATATVNNVVWDGERIFQAAKFPTEMQYQHLVFEEFARKVQPFVNVFNDYNGQLDPAILAEFAHTVYRFGHSMLTETVDRFNADWSVTNGGLEQEQIGLIEAFLNPLEFAASGLTAEAAAGAIARGMTRQYGNEIDEFVTEALRNNLVGLPLDLAAINIARGRETGVPSLNEARKDFYAGTADSQLKPYESWADFALNIKNPASIINFIAAYGTHNSITSAATVEAKRDAATAIVLGTSGAPADRLDFLNATGIYAGGVLGGLNNVDFWIGGLAEKKMVFGGMLGTTFNFVFEQQLENLQNGDRFYYLSRLANLNLTAQLENNKFSEMIHRNTSATHLPGDAFARPDFFLEVDQTKQFNGDLGSADPTSEDPFIGSFSPLVIRNAATNKVHFTGAEHVVLGGTAGNDILIGGLGDDTLWGDDGHDRLEGGEGNDFFFGGEGNDIITDKFGDDEVRSGGGDDVVSAGQGINLIITDTGNDFVWAGDDLDELLLGQGDDFGAGGADEDLLVGGEGNDWLESGLDNGLMLGDNGDLIQGLPIKRSVDSPIVGHDVLVATGGNADFDAETGDDIMVGGLGTDRFFGAFGFDWATYKNDPFGIEADMNNRLFAPPSIAGSPGAILDRYAQTEALSGSRHTDFLRGDDETTLAGGAVDVTSLGLTVAIPPDHALKDEHVSLIDGLAAFLGTIDEAGADRFSSGNILLGGAGSDVLEGRGGDDLLDGDRWLDVQIKVNPSASNGLTAPLLVNGMGEIQERLFSGLFKVADLEIVRSLKSDGAIPVTPTGLGKDIDVAQFSGERADYAIEGLNDLTTGAAVVGASFAQDLNGDGFISVAHLSRDAAGAVVVGTPGDDGLDRLKNVERALFSDQTIKLVAHQNSIASGTLSILSSTPVVDVGSLLTVSLGGVVDINGVPILTGPDADASQFTVFWQVETVPGSGIFDNIQSVVADEFAPVTGTTFTVSAAEAGLVVRALLRFKDGDGAVETVVSTPVSTIGGDGGGVLGAPVVTDPAAVLGRDLQDLVVDGVALPFGTTGILEDEAPFTFTAAQLLAGATDPNGDALSIVAGSVVIRLAAGDPVPGTLVANGTNFTFTPATNFNGNVTFEFNVTDGFNVTPAEATLEVVPVNDVPTNVVPTAGVLAGATPAVGDVVAQLATVDVDLNDTPSFTLDASTNASLSVDANGDVSVVGALGNNSLNVLTVTATDEAGAQVTQTITVRTGGAGATADVMGGGTGDDILFGQGGADTLNGNGGDDLLYGGNGADTLNGGADNDTLVGGAGADRLNGGAGDDTVIWGVGDGNGATARDAVNGGLGGTDTYVVNGDNTVEAYSVFAAADWLALGGTRSLLNANSDIVITRGGTGNGNVIAELDEIEEIIINTAGGADTVDIVGNFVPTNLAINTITVNNEEGDDEVDVTGVDSEHRTVLVGSGSITGKRTQDVQLAAGSSGDTGDDNLGEDDDDIDQDDADSGSDDASGDDDAECEDDDNVGSVPAPAPSQSGSAVLSAASANAAVLVGGGDAETLFGSDGADNIVSQGGADQVFARGGDDIVIGGDGDDHLDAGDGDDTIFGGAGSDQIFAGEGDDLVFAAVGEDMVWAGSGNDTIFLKAGSGAGQVRGEGGIDMLDLSSLTTDATIDLDGGLLASGEGTMALSGIENVIGGRGNDTIVGNAAQNVLEGGAGDDTFVYRTAADANGDQILGFQTGDKIDFRALFSNASVSDFAVTHDGADTVISGAVDGEAFAVTVVDQHIDETRILM